MKQFLSSSSIIHKSTSVHSSAVSFLSLTAQDVPHAYDAPLSPLQQEVMLLASAVLMCMSLLVLLYACYLDRLMYLHSQLRAARLGYMTIETDGGDASSGLGASAGFVTRAA
jgi:hypothetical protein